MGDRQVAGKTETTVREYGPGGELVRESTAVEYRWSEPGQRSEVSVTAATTQVNTASPSYGFGRSGQVSPPSAGRSDGDL